MSNDIERLPKWAQERIRTLERQRQDAVDALNDAITNQNPSPVSTVDGVMTGEATGPTFKTRYFQVPSGRIEIVHAGVKLTVYMAPENIGGDRGIRLIWQDPEGSLGPVAFVPTAYQSATLVAKENMR